VSDELSNHPKASVLGADGKRATITLRNIVYSRCMALGSASIDTRASVGTPGEDRRRPIDTAPNHGVTIGERVTVREFATINGGFEAPTRIGNDCYVMAHAHVGHDCALGDGVTVATGAILGGHTRVHEGANIGLGAIVHQHVTIGAYAMIGAGAVVVRDVPPYSKTYGSPAKHRGYNVVGMRRAGLSEEQIGWIESGGRTPYHDLFDKDRGRHK